MKIEITKNLEERLRHTSRDTPYDIDILAFREVDNPGEVGYELRVALERRYHQEFESNHHQGEWFHLSDGVIETIEYLNSESGFTPFTYKRGVSSNNSLRLPKSPRSGM